MKTEEMLEYLNLDFPAPGTIEEADAIRAALTERDELKARLAEVVRRAREIKQMWIGTDITPCDLDGADKAEWELIRSLAAEGDKP